MSNCQWRDSFHKQDLGISEYRSGKVRQFVISVKANKAGCSHVHQIFSNILITYSCFRPYSIDSFWPPQFFYFRERIGSRVCRQPQTCKKLEPAQLLNQKTLSVWMIGSCLSDFSHDSLSKAFELIHTGSFQFKSEKSLVDVCGILKCLGIRMVRC